MFKLALVIWLNSAAAGANPAPLDTQVRALLATAGPGTRHGLVVTDEAGRELVAIAPDDRFVPASNTKLFTTAAAYAVLPVNADDEKGGTEVRFEGSARRFNVILTGRGDARMSSAPGCLTNCLAWLADAVAARTRVVGDVIGDASLFADERWSQGMSWNNIPNWSGTAVSALSLDDNELLLTVAPQAAGQPAKVTGHDYFELDTRIVTTAEGGAEGDAAGTSTVRFTRAPNRHVVRLDGTIAAGAAPATLRLAIDDPEHYAAWRFRHLLEERGVRVRGAIRVRHQALPQARLRPPAEVVATLTPPPLAADIAIVNKASQNLHAELLLRRVGLAGGDGSVAGGQAAVVALMERAGVERWRYDLADGSGMSTYNRVTPRGTARFLRWTTTQPWGGAFRASLAVAGVDGTLRRRFVGTPLQGRLHAKTGTLNQANALAGFLTAASGRTLVFAMYAADMPGDAPATGTIDRALALVAAAN